MSSAESVDDNNLRLRHKNQFWQPVDPENALEKSAMSGTEDTKKQTQQDVDQDEPDEWDKRINKTGCAEENLKLTLCHADTGDWRQCTREMEAFKKCWAQNQNDMRTSMVDSDEEL